MNKIICFFLYLFSIISLTVAHPEFMLTTEHCSTPLEVGRIYMGRSVSAVDMTNIGIVIKSSTGEIIGAGGSMNAGETYTMSLDNISWFEETFSYLFDVSGAQLSGVDPSLMGCNGLRASHFPVKITPSGGPVIVSVGWSTDQSVVYIKSVPFMA
jgi:hypothetical protein